MARKLTERRKKFLINLSKGMKQGEAVIQAGYKVKDKHIASQMGSEILKDPKVARLLETTGVTEIQAIDQIKGALSADKPYVDKNGMVALEYPDWLVRLKSAEMILKLLGYLDKPNTNQSIQPPNIKVQFVKMDSKGREKVVKSITPSLQKGTIEAIS